MGVRPWQSRRICWACRGNPRSTVMARIAGELIGATQKTGLPGCVMRHVTTLAGIFSDRAVASHIRLIRGLVCCRSVDADGPVRKVVHLPVHNAARVVAGKA